MRKVFVRAAIAVLFGSLCGYAQNISKSKADDCRTAKERVRNAERLLEKAKADEKRAEENFAKCEQTKAKPSTSKNYTCEGMKSGVNGAKAAMARAAEQLKNEEKNRDRQCK